MTDVELEAARSEITEKFVLSISKYPPEYSRALAAACIGTVLGTSYSTDVERYGVEEARKYVATVFKYATLCAKITGVDPDFAIIDKTEEGP